MKALTPLFLLMLAACTDGTSPDSRAAESATGVFDPLIGTLDRAEGVEDVLRESAAERERQLE